MATSAPAKIREFAASSLEKIAYTSVHDIPTREPNDQYRLGYSIWMYLTEKNGTIEDAVRTSGARLLIAQSDAARIIGDALQRQGGRLRKFHGKTAGAEVVPELLAEQDFHIGLVVDHEN